MNMLAFMTHNSDFSKDQMGVILDVCVGLHATMHCAHMAPSRICPALALSWSAMGFLFEDPHLNSAFVDDC